MRSLAAYLVVAFLVSGCGGAALPTSSSPTVTPTLGSPTEPTTTEAPAGYVTPGDFEVWPFIADAGQLLCDPSGDNDGRLLVRINFGDGIEYALNGQARDFGFPELDTTVMPDWPDGSSLGPVIERGLQLCG